MKMPSLRTASRLGPATALPLPRRSLAGFTLVEMLVVVTIIGILASLITAAAIMARRRAKIAAHVMEVKQLEMACQAFKERFGEYPPDFASCNASGVIDMPTSIALVRRFIAKAFPRCPLANIPSNFGGGGPAISPPLTVRSNSALGFWLGGMVDSNGNRIGFSANPLDPFDLTTTPTTRCASRIGPFFDFDKSRITPTGYCSNYGYWPSGVTIDPPNQGSGYAYFRAENGDYSKKHFWGSAGYYPMLDGRAPSGTTLWMNPNNFQIRSCGLDGKWGAPWAFQYGNAAAFTAAAGLSSPKYEPAVYDDITNFSNGTLEDAIP